MKLKKLCIIITILSTILFTANTVFAANVQTEIITNKQEVQAKDEEEITLSLKLNEFKEIKDGLYAYKGQIKYDKNVFYEIEETDFIAQNSWESLKYNKKNNEFVIIKKS